MVFNKIKENPIMKKYIENDEDVEILETLIDLNEYLTFRAKLD